VISLLFILFFQGAWAKYAPLTEGELTQKLHQYQSISSIESTFHQVKSIKDMGIEIKSEGHFRVKRPRDIMWQIIKPSAVTISMHDNEIKIETGKGSDLQTQTYKLSEMPSGKMAESMTGLMDWLDLNAHRLYNQYTVFLETKNVFKFIPKKKDTSPFQNLEMHLNLSGFINEIQILENSGDSIDIQFDSPKITKAL
jgi:outer membrane lipoprotein-sorting protein